MNTAIGSKIPFLDLKQQFQQVKKETLEAMEQVMEQSAFSSGPFVEQFEKEFAAYCQTQHAIAVNSGTSALHLAMRALGIKEGDEVIVPANTFIATAWGVSHAGATPVFVDCDANTWNIDAEKVKAKINSKSKAIIGVHLFGQPCAINALLKVAEENKIAFVEDAAQAHGALYANKKIGGFGEMACFSFYPGKNLGAFGEGGGITTKNAAYAEKIKLLRNQGSVVKYYHEVIGYNERMDGIQGAVLSVKLKYLDGWNARRKAIAKMYQQGITHPEIKMQQPQPDAESVYHLFVITTEKRDALTKHLNECAIYPGQHYPVPCHLQKAYAHLNYKKGDCPNAEYLAEHCLSLPMYAELTDEAVSRVIDALNQFKG
ncbi:MAG: DegT/DnrJ/EryC1/StrS family aminotransferase [Chitinophagales bacterium]|nr:DegT/DnrJ/EryC1/StrS family aminotransferase [Chitinophagales bacterium]